MFSDNLETIDGVSIFPIIGLILFFLIFIGIVIWAFKADKKYIKKMENIPLENDNEESTNTENENEIQ
ncbi:MAG: cbb3-type cytochrome c oxidase subunit 3 [Ignavibacteriae bacterium]|jgi:cbb3-type cytochrome oxidase subunit 3|nr:cbb3-type cytochrome c oxidase subunit 3 [Ignavibacteriota bacterium]NOG97223.1 cbb3-type cytochrome c oxidase subunit 3 [Ignavibacteriota bacterium]